MACAKCEISHHCHSWWQSLALLVHDCSTVFTLAKLSLLFISGLDVKIQAKRNFNLNSKILLLNPATALGCGSVIPGHSLPIPIPMLLLMLFSLPGVLSLSCQPSHFPSLEGSLKYIIPALCDPLLCGIIVEFEGAWKKMWDWRLGQANLVIILIMRINVRSGPRLSSQT